MDSLTQAVLGAAVGEAVLGKKAGYKAAAWGAALGTLPDLDVLINPFLSDVAQLVYHRSFTHALLTSVVMAPVFGWLIARLHRDGPATRRGWTALAFAALFTHPLLDCFTTYGTQIFQPFSRYPVAFDALFIIDPLYTVPLAAGLILALRRPPGTARRRLYNYLGLSLSCAYLLVAVVNKTVATQAFAEALEAQGLPYERLATRPTPLNSLLWVGQAEAGDGYWVGLYSLFDDDDAIRFQRLNRNAALLDGLRQDRDVARLLWFSRGYYTVEPRAGDLVFNDIRFSRSDAWLGDEGSFIFSFRLQRDPADSSHVAAVEQLPFSAGQIAGGWRQLVARVFGRQ